MVLCHTEYVIACVHCSDGTITAVYFNYVCEGMHMLYDCYCVTLKQANSIAWDVLFCCFFYDITQIAARQLWERELSFTPAY